MLPPHEIMPTLGLALGGTTPFCVSLTPLASTFRHTEHHFPLPVKQQASDLQIGNCSIQELISGAVCVSAISIW